MLNRIFQWFEARIDPFAVAQPGPIPTTLYAFYRYYLLPVWPAFSALLVVGCIGSLIEVGLLAYVGSLVDGMREAATPDAFFTDNKWSLIGMAVVALLIRPVVSTLHDLVKNQLIAPSLTVRIRQQQHAHVLKQSLSFFQNDFAGRIANKVMQNAQALRESIVQLVDALWYAAIHFIGALVLFWAADWRLMIPLILWLAAYGWVLKLFVPRIQQYSTATAEARSMLTGRIVDSYTNILTVKLFSHTDRERDYAHGAMGEFLAAYRRAMRNLTTMELAIFALNGALMVGSTGLALWLWSKGHVTIGAIAIVTGLVVRLVAMSGWIFWVVAGIFENIGTVKEGLDTISRPIDLVDRTNATPLTVPHGDIRFENVRFHYGKEKGVLHDLSLHIKPGEKVGLVGRSGAGKSTLVNVLLRFYDLENGRILIDGQDIARGHRHGYTGYIPDASQRARQYPLWPPHCDRRGHDCGCDAGTSASVHPGLGGWARSAWLRCSRGRARREALGRAASAHRHCARTPQECAYFGARRSHERT
jgi:ATP-binding cassette, subfamily B, multidrug efflux pump